MLNKFITKNIIKNALYEDIGTGDITTLSTVGEETEIRGNFIAKEKGIVCGLDILKEVFSQIDPAVTVNSKVTDGDEVEKGEIVSTISGKAVSILTGERVALNFLQLLSGIATKTNECVNLIKGTNAKICDTRKTTPGLRIFEKYAVLTGGGHNHRFNLADGVLIKDNHIKAAGGIKDAVETTRQKVPHTLKIEVETENIEMVKEALECRADIIMLDNMSVYDMRKAVELIDGKALSEASGNMGDKNLMSVAKTGVDFISIGALTHSVKSLDISLKFV